MSKMRPGTFRARVCNYGLSNNKSGNPQIEVLFEFNDHDGVHEHHHQIRWWGQLTGEKAVPYTLKALSLLGFQGKTNDDFAKLADGVEGGMLSLDAEVDLVLEERALDGKTFMSIAFINDPNYVPGGVKNAMGKAEARVKLGVLNLAGQMASVRASQPQSQPKAAAAAKTTISQGEPDDVDFDFGAV